MKHRLSTRQIVNQRTFLGGLAVAGGLGLVALLLGLMPGARPVWAAAGPAANSFEVAPVEAAQSGYLDEVVTYTLTLTNNDVISQSYAVTAGPAVFTTTRVVTQLLSVGAGLSQPIPVLVQLPVTAAAGLSDSVVISVTLINDPSQVGSAVLTTTVLLPNLPPVAQAGPDQLVSVADLVVLTGSLSLDSDGPLPLTFGWAQLGGPAVSLAGGATPTATFTAPALPAVLTFTLSVTDALQLPDPSPDVVVVTVRDRLIAGLVVTSSAVAPGNTVTLTAAITAGTNVSYQWNFGAGAPVLAGSAAWVSHTYGVDVSGVITYTVVVTAQNSRNTVSANHLVLISPQHVFLPLALDNYAPFINGGFESGLQGWHLVNQGLPATRIENPPPPPSGLEAVLPQGTALMVLGDPGAACANVPLGDAAVEQTFVVPADAQWLVFDYVIFSQDASVNAGFDRFEVWLTSPTATIVNPQFSDGNTINQGLSCNQWRRVPGAGNARPSATAGWATGQVDVTAWRGHLVTVSFRNYSRFDHFYNTYTYLDHVHLVPEP